MIDIDEAPPVISGNVALSNVRVSSHAVGFTIETEPPEMLGLPAE